MNCLKIISNTTLLLRKNTKKKMLKINNMVDFVWLLTTDPGAVLQLGFRIRLELTRITLVYYRVPDHGILIRW